MGQQQEPRAAPTDRRHSFRKDPRFAGLPRRRRADWRELIQQVWGADPMRCPLCSGLLRPIAVVETKVEILAILTPPGPMSDPLRSVRPGRRSPSSSTPPRGNATPSTCRTARPGCRIHSPGTSKSGSAPS